MSDKPLDCVGVTGGVGKHDFKALHIGEVSTNEITPDGYVVIPPRPEEPRAPKGFKCGQCGNKFDYGKFYGYCCPHSDCPCGFGGASCVVKPEGERER